MITVYFSKLLGYALYPLSWVVLLLIIATLAVWWNRKRLASVSLTLATGLLFIISMPITGQWLTHQLEKQFPVVDLNQIETADTILLLGGGIQGSAPPWRLMPDLNDAADRVVYAAQLYHAQKAKLIIASGGTLSWRGVAQSEAEAMKQLLVQLGVPETAIIEESKSQSTYENMTYSASILSNLASNHLLIVTSAAHMPRAMATAQRNLPNHIQLHAASTDLRIVAIAPDLLDWLPQASGLEQFTQAWHEWMGWLVYQIKGYA